MENKIKYYQEFNKGEGTFYAREEGKDVGYVLTNFNVDEKFQKLLSFPCSISIKPMEGYEDSEVIEKLLINANKLYSSVTNKSLRSSSNHGSGVERYWKSLEEKGLVEKVIDGRKEDSGRWRFKR